MAAIEELARRMATQIGGSLGEAFDEIAFAIQEHRAGTGPRSDVLRFLAGVPDANLGDVAAACAVVGSRRDVSHLLDRLIREGVVDVGNTHSFTWPLPYVGEERY